MDESSTSSILIRLVGEESARVISSTLGGAVIPKKIRVADDVIKREFDYLMAGGATCMSCYRTLAEKHGLSPRNIMRIVNHAA